MTLNTEALRRSLEATAPREGPDLLVREVAALQQFVADLPDRDTRSPEEVLGYGPTGLHV
jgi:hypothetical protein